MFGFKPKIPVSDEERGWVDAGFRRLGVMLGKARMLNAPLVIPTDEFFPDPYDKGDAGARALFRRICGFMGVDPDRADLEVIPDESELLEMLPAFSHSSKGAAGLHYGETKEDRALIAITQSQLKDPLLAVATLAHELGHVILLDDGHMRRDEADMEPMTDLVTVFLGLGIFTANAARRFIQFQDNQRQGWSMSRCGYLPETIYGYALARFAGERGEERPPWTAYLNTNVKTYFRQSEEWLRRERAGY